MVKTGRPAGGPPAIAPMTMTIQKWLKEEKKRKFHRLERFFGTFERTFTVPEDADPTKIVAEFRDGVLQVHLSKRPMPKPKTIEAKVQ